MDTLSLNIGDMVELLVQVYPHEQWIYVGQVNDITDTAVVLFTDDSPHRTLGEPREIEVLFNKIIKSEVL
jgi:hypothetical protein